MRHVGLLATEAVQRGVCLATGPRCTNVIIVLGLDLPGYVGVMRRGRPDLAALIAESGHRCGACGGCGCAVRHGLRHRKRVTDVSTGAVFEAVPILRVRFCNGKTVSLLPAMVWRGRFVVDSVLETVVHVLRDGLETAYDWTWAAGSGEAVVSRRTLGRWRDIVHTRVIGSALTWLGPHLSIAWSNTADTATQLASLLDQLTAPVLVEFRAATGRAVLDKPQQPPAPPRSRARRLLDRQVSTPPPNPPSARRRRGAWSLPRPRDPPAAVNPEDGS